MRESTKPERRRQFLKHSAGGLTALAMGGPIAAAEVLGSNDRIRLGFVGLGSRGGNLLGWANKLAASHRVEIAAICDLVERRREQAADRVAGWQGQKPTICRTLGEMCDRKDVDAVVIATADFQHCYHAAHAVLAGKDVYVEKPFGCDFDQVSRARAVVAASDRIVQMGTQSRGLGKYASAANFVQSGKLGQVTYVEVSEPIFQQRWRVPGSENSLTADDVDWREYLCYLPQSMPFDARHYSEFRLFWPFSSGPFCQWMSHRIDLVNMVLGKLPCSAVALGGVYLWKDGRNNPDTMECLLEYPGGTLVAYHLRMGNSANGRGITFYGTNGTLDLEGSLAYGNGGGGLVCEAGAISGHPMFRIDHTKVLREKKAGGIELDPGQDVDFLGHFFDCVRNRQKPRADIEAGFGHSVASILANQAYRRGCKMTFDAATKRMEPAQSQLPGGYV